ncbi:hypothetical protein HA402_009293 [Bradysia odoriphaga]|nr:hypothetical protein HA402_009293 [Bradysia odoriphaga]
MFEDPDGFERGNENRRGRGAGNGNNRQPRYNGNRRPRNDPSNDGRQNRQQQGNRAGRNNANRNQYSDQQQTHGGQRNRQPNEHSRRRDHSEESNSGQQPRQGLSSNQKKNFDGPVFGFKRLYNFLTADPNEVISSIFRNRNEWEILLEQDNLAAMKTLRNGQQEMSDDLLVLLVTLLAEKVLSDTSILETKQIDVISSSVSSRSFLSKVDNKCRTYMMQDGDVVLNGKRRYGPPGTGKTFLALQIVEVLLRNPSIWTCEGDGGVGPILVVCYTNHALDSFLEGILRVFERIGQKPSMTRVGGRSKTEALDEFSLTRQRNVAAQLRQFDKSYVRMKREAHEAVRKAENERANLMTELFALNNLEEIIDLSSLSCSEELQTEVPSAILEKFQHLEWFGFDGDFEKSKVRDFDRLRRWFNVQVQVAAIKAAPPQAAKRLVEIDESDSDEDYNLDELQENRLIDDIYLEAERAENRAPKNIGQKLRYLHTDAKRMCQQMAAQLRSQQVTLRESTKMPAVERSARMQAVNTQLQNVEHQLNVINRKESFIQLVLRSYKDKAILLPDVASKDSSFGVTNNLSTAQKWAIFFYCLERAKMLTAVSIKNVNDELFNAQKQLQEVFRYGDGQILKKVKIVGMTTTGAAKYNDLLRLARSRIVIVEEAAEVLESHIVTCLTQACQHLILIGDHQQLRPSTTVYELSTQYKLDISLFERMVNNKLNCYKINVQHRMRPEIANLVVDTIYTELYNAPSVSNYPPVAGITSNLFFINHNENESSESDTKSKSNEHEAKYVAALTRYLIQQGYNPERVTVLTTYLGQMFLIKQKIREYKTCGGVRVTCVDNFQGEENDIIILSLVRSNDEGNIGFLKTDNRICVAVSRAKHGLFIIGNMSKLAAKSETWRKIQSKLSSRNEIGVALTINCQIHGITSEVSTAQHFLRMSPEGGCTKLCGAQLTSCSHQCRKVCHKDDRDHQKYMCQFPCEKSCPQSHQCKEKCFKTCPPCPVLVTKTLPCQHTPTLMCHVKEETVTCYALVEKTLPCGHKEEMACFVDATKYVCKVKVRRLLKCGIHYKEMECYKDPSDFTCKVLVKKDLPCGHTEEASCYVKAKDIPCDTDVTVAHKKCDHKEQVKCRLANSMALKCRSKCTTRLLCGHTCTLICHPDVDPDHLHFECKKDCGRVCTTGDSTEPNEHRCAVKHTCHTPCPPCKKEVKRKLPCQHEMELPCHEGVDVPCLAACEKILRCEHKCQGLCYEQCPPCKELVMKRSVGCIHSQMMPCSQFYFRDQCESLIDPLRFSSCGHSVKVPCKVATTISPMEILQYCQEPCQSMFPVEKGGCGHTCKGNSAQCLHGRLHVKCQDECGRTLICGHRCNFPCSSNCPPCQKQCIFSCEHSKCKANCGEPCVQCTEPCNWRCQHKRCTKLCSDLCDREPCDEPCQQKLKCGHDCIGYCGEICPPQCRICDRAELTEEFILYGNESDADARFVLLEDCGHAIEHEGLDYYMTHDIEEGEITAKNCPRCKTLISRSRRYGNVIKRRLKDVVEIKARKFGMTKETEKTQLILMQRLRMDQILPIHFPEVSTFLLGILCKEVMNMNGTSRTRMNKVDAFTLMTVEVMTKHVQDAVKQVTEQSVNARGQTIALKSDYKNDLVERFKNLFAILMERQIPLSVTELEDFDCEFHRLFDLKQIYLQASSLSYNISQHSRGSAIFKNLMEIMDDPCRKYELQRRAAVKHLLRALEEALSTGLGISDRERKEILEAFNLREGRWFKCPNGHYYVITECGGAMIESKCNECGATIGGGNHRIRSDNQFGGDFDGAATPLWPQ